MLDSILPMHRATTRAIALGSMLLILSLALLISAKVAAAQPRLTVLVSVDDKLPKSFKNRVVTSAKAEVKHMGTLAWSPAPKFGLTKARTLLKCIKTNAKCLRKTTAKLGVDDLLFVSFQRNKQHKAIMTLYYSRKVYSLKARALSIQLPDNRVQSEMLIKYLTARFLRGESPALILIDSATHTKPMAILPSSGFTGCQLFVDALPVPMYDHHLVLKPGHHQLRIELEGYKTVEAGIQIKSGQNFLWSTELSWVLAVQQPKKAKPPIKPHTKTDEAAGNTVPAKTIATTKPSTVVEKSTPTSRKFSAFRLSAWGSIGLGVALIGSGTGLFAWYTSVANELNLAANQRNDMGNIYLLTQAEYDRKQKLAPTLNILAISTLATGAIVGAAGLLMLLVDDTQE